MSADLGVDIGSANIVVYANGRGTLLIEPVNDKEQRPLTDSAYWKEVLKGVIHKAIGSRMFIKPRVCVCLPQDPKDSVREAFVQAALEAGAREVRVIREPLAAAMGVGIDLAQSRGNMIIDQGRKATRISVLSGSTVLMHVFLDVGGRDIDDAIGLYVAEKNALEISDRTTESIKTGIGACVPLLTEESGEIFGRDIVSGEAKSAPVSSGELIGVISEKLKTVTEEIMRILRQMPEDVAEDIRNRGLILVGGGALLKGLDRFIEEETGLPAMVAVDPVTAVARGAGKIWDV